VRRPYLDWLRGVGVLIMIEGHALDAWTRVADRGGTGYQRAILVAGIGAPIFLFLAGMALAMAAGSRVRKGRRAAEAAAMALRRGAWIFALAFLFRLQAWLISGGEFPRSLLKVDILNVMGLSMMAGALLWRAGRSGGRRIVAFATAAAGIAMVTPLVRNADWLAPLPDPLEWYLRPAPGSTTFTLFPWAGFLMGGAAAGLWLDAARTPPTERRVNGGLALIGAAVAAAGYAASFLPPLYPETTFWGGSPTFFFVRLGIATALVPASYLVTSIWRGAALQEFGRSSLFVYWIHVEMAYGVLSSPLHRRLPFEGALVALALFAVFLFALVRLKERLTSGGQSPQLTGPAIGSAAGPLA
jgi:uncharacterized membrane protein